MYRIVITKEEDVTVTEYPIKKRFDTDALPEGEEQYGPMPHQAEQVKETVMLDQRVDVLDLKRVISAVNDMPELILAKKPEGANDGPANPTT